MSSEKHWVDSDHYCLVSDDGKTSRLYQADGCASVRIHALNDPTITPTVTRPHGRLTTVFLGACSNGFREARSRFESRLLAVARSGTL